MSVRSEMWGKVRVGKLHRRDGDMGCVVGLRRQKLGKIPLDKSLLSVLRMSHA